MLLFRRHFDISQEAMFSFLSKVVFYLLLFFYSWRATILHLQIVLL